MQTFENEKNLLDYCEKHNSKKVLNEVRGGFEPP